MFSWTGDLDDDCFLLIGDYVAHVEKMSDNNWFLGINNLLEKEDKDQYHSLSDLGNFKSGAEARSFAEGFIFAKTQKSNNA